MTNTGKAVKPDKKKSKRSKKAAKAEKRMNKMAKAETAKVVEPDSVKAVVAGLLKKFVKDLERNVLVKYATADEAKALRDDIEELGRKAEPGGPFVGKVIAQDKQFAANDFAQPGGDEVPPEVLDKMERMSRMSRDPNRQLAVSAQAELTKLLAQYFPGQKAEVAATLKKRSATK